ncbi:MAG: hypothetical protein J6L24_02005 [Oscillospiraceae bacterium]|nr:hypothetical protein [Oscillospiraceae bacterium]
MRCTNCGLPVSSPVNFCPVCGREMPRAHAAVLLISRKDAKKGCAKVLSFPGLSAPIRVTLPPKTRDGQILMVKNAGFSDGYGNIRNEPLQVTVRVENSPKRFPWWLPVLAVLCCLIAAAVFLDDDAALPDLDGVTEVTVPDAEVLIPNFELKYFLNALDDRKLDIVCLLYQSMMNFEESCAMPAGVYQEDIETLLPLLAVECPELFQVDFLQNIQYSYNKTSKEIIQLQIPYRLDADIYADMLSQCDTVIDGFIADTAGIPDAEKEKYVFDSIARTCRYSIDAAHAGTAYGALVSGSAKCDGISLAMKWCMEEMKIQCLCVTAECPGETVGHAWNIINLDGAYYTLDLTMSVRDENDSDAGVEDIVYYQYNVSDAWAKERYVIRPYLERCAEIPACGSNAESYYAKLGYFVFAGVDPTGILNSALEAAAVQGEKVCIQFESEADYRSFLENMEEYAQQWFASQNRQYSTVRWTSLNFGICMLEVVK